MLLIGLMSGTSADAVDAALVEVKGKARDIKVKLIGFVSRPYPANLRKKILTASAPGGGTTAQVAQLNVEIGLRFAAAALDVCSETSTPLNKIAYIGSHGQTVAHLPNKAATLQIGEPSFIAAVTGRPVVADFRPADVAAGGQGAPLTPLADFILFRSKTKNRVIVNIGGITNITFLEAGISDHEKMVAFDTGPGNMPMDYLASKITCGKLQCDRDGEIARLGKVNERWVKEILKHPFLKKSPPKSAGREEFGQGFVESLIECFGVADKPGMSALMATITLAVARHIASAIERFVHPDLSALEIYLCGGGAKNKRLAELLEIELNPATVKTTDDIGVPSHAREAIAFALLARETMERRPGNVMAVTGATRQVVLGKIVSP